MCFTSKTHLSMTCRLYKCNFYVVRSSGSLGKQVAAAAEDLDAPKVTPKFQEHFATSSGVWEAGL